MIAFADKLLLKAYRRLQVGIHPEWELGRFLTEVARFPQIAPLMGVIEYHATDGNRMTLGLLQGYVENQGNGWAYTGDYLKRTLQTALTEMPAEADQTETEISHAAYLALVATLGQRTAQMHRALAWASGDAAFDPEPVSAEELEQWAARAQQEVAQALDEVERLQGAMPESALPETERLRTSRAALLDSVGAIARIEPKFVKTRYHGNYQLERVLLTQNDFVIVEFEGDPTAPWSERRGKHSPLKDVAGMIASFHYAAATALGNGALERPERSAKLEALVRDWLSQTEVAFLAAYAQAMQGSPAYPEDPATVQALIDMFMLQRACHELGSALKAQRHGVARPIDAILGMIGKVRGEA
jgi:maltose alpha-D-glucosyltransferase / alpha-amylase